MRVVNCTPLPSRPNDKAITLVTIKYSDGITSTHKYNGKLKQIELKDFVSGITFADGVTVTKMRYFEQTEEVELNVMVK